MFREVVFFESLFKGSKWSWLFGWLFHFGMLIVLAQHFRYFTQPVWSWVVMIQWVGSYASFAMFAGLAGLWARRVLVDRIRYISAPSDHLMLALLLAIAGSGLVMKHSAHTDIVSLKAFSLGLVSFDWQPLPADAPLLVHLSLVIILMLIFPSASCCTRRGCFSVRRAICAITRASTVTLRRGPKSCLSAAAAQTEPSAAFTSWLNPNSTHRLLKTG